MVFNKALKKMIQSETNIEVRQRHEAMMRRNYNILLILFLGGGYMVFRHFLTLDQGLFMAVIFLAWYGFLENVQHRYAEHTDELIKAKDSKPVVKPVAKKAKAKKK